MKFLFLLGLLFLTLSPSLFASNLTVLFVHGKSTPELRIGESINTEQLKSIELKSDAQIFFRNQSKCFKIDQEGVFHFSDLLDQENSFLCKTELFLKRIINPRVVAGEYLPRGKKSLLLVREDVFFEQVWEDLVRGESYTERLSEQTLIGTAAYYEAKENRERVAWVFSILAERNSIFKKFYQDTLGKVSLQAMNGEVAQSRKQLADRVSNRRNLALLIGVDHYQSPDWQNLDNPVRDVNEIKKVLIKQYHFNKEDIIVLEDATFQGIIDAFDSLVTISNEESNLLVYYAGHGHYPFDEKMGFWIPSDAGGIDSFLNFINTSVVLSKVESIPAKHTLLIADACFSGDLIEKSRNSSVIPSRFFLSLSGKNSRQIITAGGLEYVNDRGGGEHSVFASSLLRELKIARKTPLSASELALNVRKHVKNTGGNQTPSYGRFAKTHDNNGEFFFVQREQKVEDYEPQEDFFSIQRKQSLEEEELLKEKEMIQIKKRENTMFQVAAVSTALISGWVAYQQGKERDALIEENGSIRDKLNTPLALTEYSQILNDFEENKEQISKHNQNIQTLNIITTLGALAEAYLLYVRFFDSDYQSIEDNQLSLSPSVIRENGQLAEGVTLAWRLKW